MSATTTHNPQKFISFGYRCSSAGILKEMGLKQESLPFDWLVSRLPVIAHCIGNDNFGEFMNQANYVERHTNTFARPYNTEKFICDEYILANKYYQPTATQDSTITYEYNLAMNHYNITDDREYYMRCIERWRTITKSPTPLQITYLHILPVQRLADLNLNQKNILNEINNLNNILQSYIQENPTLKFSGLIFLMVEDEENNTETTFEEITLQNNLMTTTPPPPTNIETQIYKICVNKDFIDAGEIFMGKCNRELDIIKAIVREHAVR